MKHQEYDPDFAPCRYAVGIDYRRKEWKVRTYQKPCQYMSQNQRLFDFLEENGYQPCRYEHDCQIRNKNGYVHQAPPFSFIVSFAEIYAQYFKNKKLTYQV